MLRLQSHFTAAGHCQLMSTQRQARLGSGLRALACIPLVGTIRAIGSAGEAWRTVAATIDAGAATAGIATGTAQGRAAFTREAQRRLKNPGLCQVATLKTWA